MSNEVAVRNEVPRFKVRQRNLIAFSQALLKELGYRNIFLSIVFVADQSMKRLNRKYLNHPWVTDVLAFRFRDILGARRTALKRLFLGEIIISPEQARANAKEYGVSLAEELALYLCHGLLHLKGYTDHSIRLRNKMRRAEAALLKALGAEIKGIV